MCRRSKPERVQRYGDSPGAGRLVCRPQRRVGRDQQLCIIVRTVLHRQRRKPFSSSRPVFVALPLSATASASFFSRLTSFAAHRLSSVPPLTNSLICIVSVASVASVVSFRVSDIVEEDFLLVRVLRGECTRAAGIEVTTFSSALEIATAFRRSAVVRHSHARKARGIGRHALNTRVAALCASCRTSRLGGLHRAVRPTARTLLFQNHDISASSISKR